MRAAQSGFLPGTLLLVSVMLAGCETGETTDPAPTLPAVISSMGTDFYLTLPDHLCVSTPSACNDVPVINSLVVAAATTTSGEVSFNGVTTPFTVTAGSETLVPLDPAVVLTSNETIEAKGVHVTAQAPVSVHVMSESATSADGYLALPTAALGTHYYVMARASAFYTGSQFAVVASADNTTVSITPAAAGASEAAGVSYSIVLDRGETYQLVNPALGDMTGSLVSADKPVAVFGSHRCAEVPARIGYCDYLVEQIPAVALWGKVHHTVPFAGRSRYTARVLAAEDGTTLTTTPSGLIGTLNAGEYADVVLSEAAEFIADKPVLVAQFIHGYDDDTAAQGDPSMVLVTPAPHDAELIGVTESTFAVYGLNGTSGAMINVVTETAALDELRLDGVQVLPSLFTPVTPGSAYSRGTLLVAPGTHTLSGAVPYSALVYDYGITYNSLSYAYPAGATLTRSITPTPEPVEPEPDSEPTPAEPLPGDCTDAMGQNRHRHHNHTIHGAWPNGGTGHDARVDLHSGDHAHQHAHDHSHDNAHDHAHKHGDSLGCQDV